MVDLAACSQNLTSVRGEWESKIGTTKFSLAKETNCVNIVHPLFFFMKKILVTL